jgi:hypothetical protein
VLVPARVAGDSTRLGSGSGCCALADELHTESGTGSRGDEVVVRLAKREPDGLSAVKGAPTVNL